MNDPTSDVLERRIDSALGRLPHWAPPADFSARLAAAAARQASQPGVAPSLVRVGLLLRLLSDSALLVIASLGVATVFAWGIPWNSLLQSTQLLGWTSVIGFLLAGLWATLRTLPRS